MTQIAQMAAALASGRYRPDTVIDTAPGRFEVAGHTVKDHRDYGQLELSGVIQKSSNVGMAKIALALDAEAIWNVYRAVGFGEPTHGRYPGETAGVLPA